MRLVLHHHLDAQDRLDKVDAVGFLASGTSGRAVRQDPAPQEDERVRQVVPVGQVPSAQRVGGRSGSTGQPLRLGESDHQDEVEGLVRLGRRCRADLSGSAAAAAAVGRSGSPGGRPMVNLVLRDPQVAMVRRACLL